MSKTCNYCGKVNTDDACACGEGQWDGCGAALPTIELDTSCTLVLPHETLGVKPHLPPRVAVQRRTGEKVYLTPSHGCQPVKPVFQQPGMTARKFQRDVEAMKTEIGLALLPALQEALRQWGGR